MMAERKSLLPPSPRGNASKGGLHSVPPPRARGGFSLAPSPRARSRIPPPVRGAFFHRLRSGSPHGSAPFPCGTLGVGGELQKAAPSAPPPCGTTFSFPRSTGSRPRGNVASLSGAFSPPCRTRSPARPPFRGASASPSFSLTIPAPGGYNARAAAGTYSSAG